MSIPTAYGGYGVQHPDNRKENMKRTPKRVNLTQNAIAIVLIPAILTACQCAPADEAQVEPTTIIPTVEIIPTEGAQVEVFYVSIFQGAETGSPEAYLIEQFQTEHPEISVDRGRYWASPSAYLNWLRQYPFTAVLSIPADYNTRQAIEEELLLDLTGILARTDLDKAYPEDFQAMLAREGRVHFLPTSHSWFALYYNAEIFDRYDFVPPETWEEFLIVCETLSENGVAPIVYAGDDRQMVSVWFDYLDMRLNGPEFHAALMDGEEHYTDEKVRDVFDTWQFLVESGYVLENSWDLQAEASMDMVIGGQAAMILAPGYQSHDELGFFRFPTMDSSIPVGELAPTVGYVVLANSPEIEAALELLSYLGSAEAQSYLARQINPVTGFLPLHRAVDREDLFTPEMHQAAALVEGADAIRQPYFWCFGDNLLNSLSSIFRNILLGRDYADELERLEKNHLLIVEASSQ
jgi:ABC-type glycerol-3-phosphate transport system substrate-binding protein